MARVLAFFLLVTAIVLLSPFGTVLSYLLIIALSLAFMAASGIGLRPGSPLPGAALGLLSISAVLGLTLATGVVTVTRLSSDVGAVLLFGVALQLLVASGEELAFRGYILPGLEQATGRKAAIAASSAAFAVVHIASMALLGVGAVAAAIALATIFLAGVLLALLYVHGGILSACGFHFCWNFLQYHVYGLGLRGEMPSIVHLAGTGSLLATGGAFGPEASLPGLAAVLATLGIVLFYFYGKKWKMAPVARDR
jgi:hypothetical protein